jgi:transcription elongation factor GreA
MDTLPVTAAGHAALEDELQHRTRVERPRLVQRIQEAIADAFPGSLSAPFWGTTGKSRLREKRADQIALERFAVKMNFSRISCSFAI